MKQKNSIDMVNGPLYKNIIVFAIPLMLTQLLQLCFNAADTIVVGKFAGQEALAAVGATGSLCFLLISMFGGLGMGASVVIGQFLGARDEKNVSNAVHTGIALAFVAGLFLTVIGVGLSRPLLEMMSTPEDIIDLSQLYLRIFFSGMVFNLSYNFGAAIMRAKGDTKRPLYYLTISGVVNVVLNLIFVIFLKMSVAGVALATIISQMLSCVLVLGALMRETDATHLDLKKLKLHKEIVVKTLRIGIPAGIQGAVFALSNVIIQSCVNSFGSVVVAANSAAANIEGFGYIAMGAFSQATVSFTSQNVGAKKFDNVDKVLKATIIYTFASSVCISVPLVVFGRFFLGFYTNEAAVIETGMIRLTIVVLTMVFNGLLDIFVGSLRGMGYSTVPTVAMIIGICGVRLGWIFAIFPIWGTLQALYVCYPLSWIISTIIQVPIWLKIHKDMKLKFGA